MREIITREEAERRAREPITVVVPEAMLPHLHRLAAAGILGATGEEVAIFLIRRGLLEHALAAPSAPKDAG